MPQELSFSRWELLKIQTESTTSKTGQFLRKRLSQDSKKSLKDMDNRSVNKLEFYCKLIQLQDQHGNNFLTLLLNTNCSHNRFRPDMFHNNNSSNSNQCNSNQHNNILTVNCYNNPQLFNNNNNNSNSNKSKCKPQLRPKSNRLLIESPK